MTKWFRWVAYAAFGMLTIAVIAFVTITWLWQNRAPLSDLGWPVAESAQDADGAVTVTWLGISTLLFDDGETQILTDGTFTRLSLNDFLLLRPVRSNIANINYALDEFHINHLATIIPLHSHFDHAMDVGNVANRTTAVVLGSESTANIARGANVPVDQYQILASGESRTFGDFTVTLIETVHAPLGPGGSGWFSGIIDVPLVQPAWIPAWQGGAVYSLLVSHPRGTTLVQASAGISEGLLASHHADVVMLSVAGLASLGKEHTQQYWQETVTATGADRVYAIHFDDFTRPFGEVALFPNIADNVTQAAQWIDECADRDEIVVQRPPFGIPITLY
ncbi:MAG: MBL fold metallo-hydrolase [Proteobacteria bacterium]|nr:MBL fold metallo-hydrolase [Pseudomonadota bacterium]